MVEFALIAPVLLLLLVGAIDVLRMLQSHNTVAEAARQGARQAVANAQAADQPFSAGSAGTCSGTGFTSSAGGSGCLTDQRILETVRNVMGPLSQSFALLSGTTAQACPNPGGGQVNVCIAPGQNTALAAYPDCQTARRVLGHEPQAGELGGRQGAWANEAYKGCFLVQVTVAYSYSPLVGFVSPFVPGGLFQVVSSTAMVAEY